ncbi:hypothetical protein H4R22_001931 [Coemansia sp. RSA 1290]|nr:hypothetical protein BX667DRAFT_499903 [Coemansia mojavensis]KAJ1740272.1 hypothetical protein LPJ68_003914 [Coemansia sp. RSA 1086]KAJ2631510.1 hypothetical protein H4R22_001931 [Coemansia sp. RSA 1290]KAJ2646885.1 hypothetical protein IWW40_005105 [Coemansia sp. RSA 1250]
MASKSEESILRSRLIVEDRTLKRCLRQLSTLCTRHPQLTCQEAQQASKHVLQEVRWFRHTVQVAVQSQQRCLDELQLYSNQQSSLEQQITEISRDIERLSDSLEESRNHKRHKIAYDEIAAEANKLPSRKQIEEEILQINNDIEQLEQEQVSHEAVTQSLNTQYAVVVEELNKLASMSKSALSMQDLDIYLDSDVHPDKPDANARSTIMSPSAINPHGFDTPIDADMLDIQNPKDSDEEGEAEDGEDGFVETESIVGSEEGEEGECEDEEGELLG